MNLSFRAEGKGMGEPTYNKFTDNARHTHHKWGNVARGSGEEEPETNNSVGDVPGPLEWGAWTRPWQPSPT